MRFTLLAIAMLACPIVRAQTKDTTNSNISISLSSATSEKVVSNLKVHYDFSATHRREGANFTIDYLTASTNGVRTVQEFEAKTQLKRNGRIFLSGHSSILSSMSRNIDYRAGIGVGLGHDIKTNIGIWSVSLNAIATKTFYTMDSVPDLDTGCRLEVKYELKLNRVRLKANTAYSPDFDDFGYYLLNFQFRANYELSKRFVASLEIAEAKEVSERQEKHIRFWGFGLQVAL